MSVFPRIQRYVELHIIRIFRGAFLLCSIRCSPSCFVGVLLALLFAGALFWAKGRDPFQRVWFKVRAPGQGNAECIAVLPKTSLKSKVHGAESKVPGPKSKVEALVSEPSTLNARLSTTVLLIHGEQDEVFPLSQARQVAAWLETTGVPVELKGLPGESHGVHPGPFPLGEGES